MANSSRNPILLCAFAVILLPIFNAAYSPLAAQSLPTATQAAQLSVFAGPTGVYTRVGEGRNGSITAGVDLTLKSRFSIRPSLEIRGTFPVIDGQVDSQKNLLGGLRLAHPIFHIEPYVDVLFGRGSIHYDPPFPNPQETFFYIQTPANVLAVGAGLKLPVSSQFAILADAQYQRYSTPVSLNGHIHPIATTLAFVYRFDFNHPRRRASR